MPEADIAQKGKQRVVIVGGGLAGMVVARELLKHNDQNMEVVILEATPHLGGKAGAGLKRDRGVYEEHGYHIFPGWYANTRHLLKELDLESNLQNVEKFHLLKKGEWKKGRSPKLRTFYPMSCPWYLLENVLSLSKILSWSESLLAFYAMVDLCSQSFDERAYLDRVTANGFFYSRFYATEGLAAFHTNSILQATSTPTYLISAMTLKKATSLWFAEDIARWRWTPQKEHKVYSILKGNLQQKFIEPFQQNLVRLGADIKMSHRAQAFEMKNGRVSSVKVEYRVEAMEARSDESEVSGENVSVSTASTKNVAAMSTMPWPDKEITGDIFVLATPPETVLSLLGDEIRDFEEQLSQDSPDQKRLSDAERLRREPMTALHMYFKSRLEDVPKEHVNLLGSRYGLSFIDVSQQWQEYGGPNLQRTVLSVIAADCAPLRKLGDKGEGMVKHLLADLRKYIPYIPEDIVVIESDGDFEKQRKAIQDSELVVSVNLNFDTPLFLNTVGSWQFRPKTKSHILNLYVTGDYCRTEADLTTMESAVLSGLCTARDLLKDTGITNKVRIKPLRPLSRGLLLVLKYGFLPLVFLLTLWLRVQGKGRISR